MHPGFPWYSPFEALIGLCDMWMYLPLVSMVLSLEFSDRSSSPDGQVIGVEHGIDDQTTIIDQAAVIDSWTGRERERETKDE